ncbi:MAG: ATP-binding cassette domain-containing protein [Alphaproteobacteria bacterium]|nr:ATP-binding cassette domain-containing protein [Alphaproteobacteria bacterium]
MAQVSTALEIDVRSKVFPAVAKRGENCVLQNINLQIAPKSFVVLTGPSGCGKSTLLNIVAGLDEDFDGSIRFQSPDARRGYIFQSPRLLPWRTIEENILLALPDGDPRRANVSAMLDRVGLTEAANAYPERVSLGMQRRASLARGFILEPDILLMDEPFVSLDDPTAQDLRKLLIDLYSRRPTTILFVTHDRAEAVMLATRILRMDCGSASIVQDEAVRLGPEDRSDRSKVQAEQARIFSDQ